MRVAWERESGEREWGREGVRVGKERVGREVVSGERECVRDRM